MLVRKTCKKLNNDYWRLKFEQTTKLYIHKPESILENETNKILWDFKIITDSQISARKSRPNFNE